MQLTIIYAEKLEKTQLQVWLDISNPLEFSTESGRTIKQQPSH